MTKNLLSSPIILHVERVISDLRRGVAVKLVTQERMLWVSSGEHYPDKPVVNDATHPAVKLMKLAGLLPLAVCETHGDDAIDYLSVTEQEIAAYPASLASSVVRVSEASVPLKEANSATMIAYRSRYGHEEHLAIVVGKPAEESAPLVRVHSSCVTGDVFGSLRCDCGNQLHQTLERMRAHGAGVLLYISQEGRGIGIANKLRAYQLQDTGLDTVDANLALGFAVDERDFSLAAAILHKLAMTKITLLTNNPDKVSVLQDKGIEIVRREPLATEVNPHNMRYLQTKIDKLHHQFTE